MLIIYLYILRGFHINMTLKDDVTVTSSYFVFKLIEISKCIYLWYLHFSYGLTQAKHTGNSLFVFKVPKIVVINQIWYSLIPSEAEMSTISRMKK